MLLPEDLIGLTVLAEGNVRLVEEAIHKCMKYKRDVWWKFWVQPEWQIDKFEVIEYIKTHRYDAALDINVPLNNML